MSEQMTIDKLIEICEHEYNRGLATAKYSKFDNGYATAFKLCLTFAKEIKENFASASEVEIIRCGECKY